MTNGELSKTPSNVWQKLKWSHKEGNLDKCQISAEMARMPKSYQGFGQIFKWHDNGASWQLIVDFTTMTNLTRIKTTWQNRHVDDLRIYDYRI